MDSAPIFLTVISIWSLAAITPGPNFFICIQTSVKYSRLSGIYVVFGICTGTMVWAISGYFGISYLFLIAPWIYVILKIVGGSYLIYLGINCIFKDHKKSKNIELSAGNTQRRLLHWQRGLVTNLSNPKTAIFITSLFASALPQKSSFFVGMSCVILMTSISLVWYLIVVFILSSKGSQRFFNCYQNWIQSIAGIIFIIFGAKLIFEQK